MFMKIILLLAPLILSPVIFYLLQMLIPVFLKEGARIFLAVNLPGRTIRAVSVGIAVRCVFIFVQPSVARERAIDDLAAAKELVREELRRHRP